ncbi:MAG: VWA domain-containing protein [Synergistaceae bacterium]|nr:VWA domain-containing protein [Synergistaceae bacterium]
MRIANNTSALTAFNALNSTNKSLAKTLHELSTGLRINSPADDVASFAVSQKLRSQISGLAQASHNAQDAISLLQTAEGAMSEANTMLQRMRNLALQASNDILTQQDRAYLQLEIDELKANIDRLANDTTFNNKKLLDGSLNASWSSDDPNLKARINGDITGHEGTYRIQITTYPGVPQVQASKEMHLRTEGLLINKSVNHDAGVQDISVNNIPDGRYDFTSALPTQARIIPSGVYGLNFQELEESLSASIRNSHVLSNASILFEVIDTTDTTITLNAHSSVLNIDGTTEEFTAENITLTQGEFADLSEVLGIGIAGSDNGVPDGAMELKVNDASAFSKGNKFVYNVSTANGTDRTINISSLTLQATHTPAVMKTNTFKPNEPLPSAAKVVFLIDNSLSMGASFQMVKEHISSFIESIMAEGAEDVKVGIARYLTGGLQNSSYDWYETEEELTDALAVNLVGGSVDPYKAITDALSSYDMGDVAARHIVLITDTGQEVPKGGTLLSAQEALKNSGVTLSAVSTGTAAITSLITEKGIDLRIGDREWGNKLVNDLGGQIGREAIATTIRDTPLSEYRELAEAFPDGTERLKIRTDSSSYSLEIDPEDTMSSVIEKLNEYSGVNAEVSYADDLDDGEKGLTLTLQVEDGSNARVSGGGKLLNALGLKSGNDTSWGIDSGSISGEEIVFKNYYLDSESGEVLEGELKLKVDEAVNIGEYEHLAGFETSHAGDVVSGGVKLRDIEEFWAGGEFVLSETEELVLMQGGKSVKVELRGEDTIDEVRRKLNDAISEGLGQGKYADDDGKFCVISKGRLLVNSAVSGRVGEIEIAGSDRLMMALGLNEERRSCESVARAAVYDAVSGQEVNSMNEECGNEFFALIPPEIDIMADAMSGLSANWNEATQRFMLARQRTYTAILQLKHTGTVFQVGADIGETFSVRVGDMSSYGLGVSRVNVGTRSAASESVSILDKAIRRTSEQRARLGAYVNGLEGVLETVNIEESALTGTESRIRDADIADVMMEYVRLKVLNRSGISMLAQANQLSESVLSLMQ